MKRGLILKIVIDVGMTILLMLLMAFELIGRTAHEWIGMGMFALFALHHILNRKWIMNLSKGRYTAQRILQTGLVALVTLTMLGSMVSGIMLSKHVFAFLSFPGWRRFAQALHMLAAYWGFVLMSLHLGIHWNMMMGMAKRLVKKPSRIRAYLLRSVAGVIAGYGIHAFISHDITSYLFLKQEFAFFDFGRPLILFFIDYIAMMGLFVVIGHYFSELLRKSTRKAIKNE